jgi:hypothetical protein
MRALSIRQPYAELILLGRKTVEYRSFATRILGERFWIYATKLPVASYQLPAKAEAAKRIWSDDLAVTGNTGETPVPRWMMELAEEFILDKLPRGVIVGSAVIEKCVRCPVLNHPHPNPLPEGEGTRFEWHLEDVKRLDRPRRPARHPQPSWFNPF